MRLVPAFINSNKFGPHDIINKFRVPRSVSCNCPSCGNLAIFSLCDILRNDSLLNSGKIAVKIASCPSCQFKATFSIYFNPDRGEDEHFHPIGVSIYPSSNYSSLSFQTPPHTPERVAKAVNDAHASLQSGLYSPSLTSGGRALEGLFKHLVASDDVSKKTLFNLIEAVTENDEVKKPLKQLAHVIRESRNKGAHFDEEIDPDEETATLTLELLHYLLDYFYGIPEKIALLEKRMKKPDSHS